MSRPAPFGPLVDRHRLIVTVGTGGVGKTTIAAALALAGALRGRRAMVLTIDPARQLARALGLEALRGDGERVAPAVLAAAGLAPAGSLHAGMLDQKSAWDGFIARHAPAADRDRILANAFYQQLSSSFAGSTEYVAVEELCRLDESGRFDLIVLDTPPAAHALDFLQAPERIDRLLGGGLAGWLGGASRAAGRAASVAVRFLVRRLERATGAETLRDVSALLSAMEALWAGISRRTERARALLRRSDTAFVLVAGPEQSVLAATDALAERMRLLGVSLAGAVLNRVHPLPGPSQIDSADVAALLARLAGGGVEPAVLAWLEQTYAAARLRARAEAELARHFTAALGASVAFATVAEGERDLHSLRGLAEVARRLCPAD